MITLTAYTGVKFQRNHLIEELTTYLAAKECFIFDNAPQNQFKIAALRDFESNMTSFRIRISVKQGKTTNDVRKCNYIKLYDEHITRYYFVTGVDYVSERVFDLNVVLDVVNTYRQMLISATFCNVKMQRRMKDRWKLYNQTYYRVYDKCDEGLGDIATQVEYNEDVNSGSSYFATTTIPDSDSLHLPFPIQLDRVYLNEGAKMDAIAHEINGGSDLTIGQIQPSSKQLIRCLMYCDSSDDILTGTVTIEGQSSSTSAANAIYINTTLEEGGTYYYIRMYNGIYSNGVFTPMTDNIILKIVLAFQPACNIILSKMFGSGSYKVLVQSKNSTDTELTIGTPYSKSDIIEETSTYSSKEYITTAYIDPISSLNKSDSNIQQINDVPFVPSKWDLIYLGTNLGTIVKGVASSTYTLDLNVSGSEPRHYTKAINKKVMNRDIRNESKLYGSYVRNHQIVYDTFALPVQPEYYNGYTQTLSTTIYKPTGMSNDVAFKCNTLVEQSLNSNVMSCSRNNQITVYSNEYLNYLRNGYNYDEKSQSLNKIKTCVNVGLSGVSTGLNLAFKKSMGSLGGYSLLGSATNTISGLSSAIFSNIENDRALAQKRLNLLNTSPTTSGSTSVDLFKQLNGGNKLKYVTTKPSDEVLNATYNLFYFYGYKDNTTKATLTLDKTREYFDYYQGDCDNVVATTQIDGTQGYDLIKQALSEGITIEYYYSGTWLCDGHLYENWETSI